MLDKAYGTILHLPQVCSSCTTGGISTLVLLLIARTKFSEFSDQSHYR